MKHKLAYIILCLCFPFSAKAQTTTRITGVDFSLDNFNNIVVNYSITNYSATSTFIIRLTFITEDNQTVVPKTVYGDIGPNIPGGTGKSILWNFQNDGFEYTGKLKAVVSVITPSNTMPAATRSDVLRYNPGKNAVAIGLSLLIPGTGGYLVEKSKIRAVCWNAAAAGTLAYMIYQGTQQTKWGDLADKATNQTDKQKYWDLEDKAEDKFKTATIAYVAVLWSDVIWVAYKGIQNNKAYKRSIRNYSLNGPAIDYNGKEVRAGLVISF